MLNEVIMKKINNKPNSKLIESLKFIIFITIIAILVSNSGILGKKSKVFSLLKKSNSKNNSANFSVIPLVNSNIKEIVQLHNNLRNQIASGEKGLPKAADMLQLYWSRKIAQIVFDYLVKNDCQDEYSNTSTFRGMQLGVNVASREYTQTPESSPFTDFINTWFSEIENFKKDGDVQKFNKNDSKHFSQLIWHDSEFLGCAYCFKQNGSKVKEVFVCQYSKKGNYIATPVYNTGDNCQCAQGYACNNSTYKSLCCREDDNWCSADFIFSRRPLTNGRN